MMAVTTPPNQVAPPTPDQDQLHYQAFITFGVFVGGALPVLLVYLANKIGAGLVAPRYLTKFEYAMALFMLVIVVAALVVHHNYKMVRRAEGAIALASFVSLGIFTYCSGGPTASVFSFHYLYVPMVVGLMLDKKTFVQTIVFYSAGYVICAIGYYGDFNKTASAQLASAAGGALHIATYVVILMLQMWMLYLMIEKSHLFRRLERAEGNQKASS
jgi:hypothetical protein